MDQLGRDLDESGREIAPDVEAARRRLDARTAPAPPGAHRAGRILPTVIGIGVAAVLAGVLGTTLVLRQSGSSSPPPAAAVVQGAGQTGQLPTTAGAVTGVAGDAGTATGSATAVAPQTVQPLQTLPPTSVPRPSQGSSASSVSTAAGSVLITESTAGPVSVHRGQTVQVQLSASSQAWSEPQSSDQSILRRTGGATHPDGSSQAFFTAVADGSVSISAVQAPPACYPKCLPPQRAWDVTVDITG